MTDTELAETIARWQRGLENIPDDLTRTCIVDVGKLRRVLDAAEAGVRARDAALEEAAQCIEKKHTHNVLGTPHPMAISDAAAIRALKQDRGEARSEGGAA